MIFCNRCGTYSANGTSVCPQCQADLAAFGHESMSGSSPRPHVTAPAATASLSTAAKAVSSGYGGFGNRLLAVIVDGLLVTVATMVPIFLILFVVVVGVKPNPRSLMGLGATLVFLAAVFAVVLLLPIAYEVVMIAKRGATYGKAYRKLIVVRTDGEPVSTGRSILRVLIKMFLSQILFIGYLLALFTAKKQTLHDLIADTVVMKSGE